MNNDASPLQGRILSTRHYGTSGSRNEAVVKEAVERGLGSLPSGCEQGSIEPFITTSKRDRQPRIEKNRRTRSHIRLDRWSDILKPSKKPGHEGLGAAIMIKDPRFRVRS